MRTACMRAYHCWALKLPVCIPMYRYRYISYRRKIDRIIFLDFFHEREKKTIELMDVNMTNISRKYHENFFYFICISESLYYILHMHTDNTRLWARTPRLRRVIAPEESRINEADYSALLSQTWDRPIRPRALIFHGNRRRGSQQSEWNWKCFQLRPSAYSLSSKERATSDLDKKPRATWKTKLNGAME